MLRPQNLILQYECHYTDGRSQSEKANGQTCSASPYKVYGLKIISPNSPEPCTDATLDPVLSTQAVARAVGAKDWLSTLMTRLALSAGTKRPTLDSVFILLQLRSFCVTNACRHFARQTIYADEREPSTPQRVRMRIKQSRLKWCTKKENNIQRVLLQ